MFSFARVGASLLISLITAASGAAQAVPASGGTPCEKLTALALPHTTITIAEAIGAGGFHRPSGEPASGPSPQPQVYAALPAFCRVAASLKPSSDSDITIEIWLPAAGWNGKFQGVGNGGWSGGINYVELAEGLGAGYATAATDTGHRGSGADASFALGHPEKLTDFAYRAVHEMTVEGKAIAAAYYGTSPRIAFWNGCSTGGKQGLTEAQRFPADYDGIIAIASANNWTPMLAAMMSIAQTTSQGALPREKFAMLHKAVLDACDGLDGVKDGVLENPAACHFDPSALQCAADDQPACLTVHEVAVARRMYADTVNPRTGGRIFPGFARGSELGWTPIAGSAEPFPIPLNYFKFVVFKDPAWDYRGFDIDKDLERAERADAGLTADDPSLKPYFDRGGKLLLVHGWADQLISPQNTIDYYSRVSAAVGPAASAQSMRLFMVPGMGHCGGGAGPNAFNALDALTDWVERTQAPERIVASHSTAGKIDRTRPLCPYPQVATYKGPGSTDDAANFVCGAPK